nr:unnamed protein product [Callosobruchus analis]
MPIFLLDNGKTGQANDDELLSDFVAHSTLSSLADEADIFSMDPHVTYDDCDIEVPNILTEKSGYRQISVNSPEKRLHFEESGTSACIGTFLNVPEMPVRKCSCQTERVSFVISFSAIQRKTRNENIKKCLQTSEEATKNKNIKKKSAKNNEKAASNQQISLNLTEEGARGTSHITRIERCSPVKISTTENVTVMRRTRQECNIFVG